jgi:hypothetical protein
MTTCSRYFSLTVSYILWITAVYDWSTRFSRFRTRYSCKFCFSDYRTDQRKQWPMCNGSQVALSQEKGSYCRGVFVATDESFSCSQSQIIIPMNALILTICPNSVFHCEKGIVHFSIANFRGSSVFKLELQNRAPNTLRLWKLDKFCPLPGFKGSFFFSKNNKNLVNL